LHLWLLFIGADNLGDISDNLQILACLNFEQNLCGAANSDQILCDCPGWISSKFCKPLKYNKIKFWHSACFNRGMMVAQHHQGSQSGGQLPYLTNSRGPF
jgi:hypothetical protein